MQDDDGDGIVNSKDSCPQEKGSIERNGCPPCSDGDKDGICDTEDKCPNVKGVKACDGCVCPPHIDNDYDNDGIPNSEDACDWNFGFRRYKGCPIPDTDRDGVNDEIDKCNDLKGTIACKGCTDKDGDGVCDEIDGCIDIRGLIENNGCPKILITLDGTKFKIDGDFDKSKGYTAKLFVNNTKGIVKKFDFQDSKCPSNSTESHAFANQLEAFDLKVTIIVYYNGTKVHEQIFPKMKYVCIKGQDCGFKNM